MTSIIKNKKGSVLLMTLFVLSGILVVALAASQIVDSGIKTGRIQSDSTKSYFAAETGIEQVLWEVRKNNLSLPDSDDPDFLSGTLSNNAVYQTSYSTSTPNVYFTVAGVYKSTKRSVEVNFQTSGLGSTPSVVCEGVEGCDAAEGENCSTCPSDCLCGGTDTCQSGVCTPPTCPDADGDTYTDSACGGDDCDDTDPNINPGEVENCLNGIDDDCDNLVDNADSDCPSTFTLVYSAGAHGSISGDASQTVVYGGSGTSVTAVSATGYHFLNWSDTSTSNPRTDTNITQNINVTANFVINTYTLTYTACSGGNISGNLTQTVNYGLSGTTVTASPNSGYNFVSWSDGYTSASRTDTNVTENKSLMANFSSYSCGSVTDDDGNVYGAVQIGSQCWMAKNIKVGTMIDIHISQSNDSTIEKYCRNNVLANCDANGGFYRWDEAMLYSTAEGSKGICPTGWHIPTDNELYILENYLKNSGETCVSTRSLDWDCVNAGAKIKSCGSSGFNALLTGFAYTPTFYNYSKHTYLLSSSQMNAKTAWSRNIEDIQDGVNRYNYTKIHAFPVRCIKN